MQATAALNLRYTSPGNSQSVANLNAMIEYVGSCAGFLDIPEGTVDGATFAVPFGSVGAAKSITLQNNTALAKEIAINASEDVWSIGPGAMLIIAGIAAGNITSITVIETATSGADGTVAYVVLGDSETP